MAFEGRFKSCMASIHFVMSFRSGSAIWAAMKSFNGPAQSWNVEGGSTRRVGAGVGAGVESVVESVVAVEPIGHTVRMVIFVTDFQHFSE